MNSEKKTITIFAVLLTVLLIPSGIVTYAESDDTQTQQTSKIQNLKQAFDDIETLMIQNQISTSGMRSPVGSSPVFSVNMVMINEDAGELWVGIDRSKYSGSLDSFENHLQNRYPNTTIRVEHADFEWNACPSLKSKTCNPQVSGMRYTVVTSAGGQTPSSLGLATEDNDGKKGVVITAHSVGHGTTGTDIYSNVKRMTTAGVVQNFDIHHGQVIKNTAPDSSKVVPCDCAFVEFEKDSKGRYIETVEKNKIYKGRNAVYTVTGVHDPVGQESIKLVGQKINTVKDGHVLGTNLSFTIDKITVRGAFATTLLAGQGDSGGPIFTTPNSNDEVEIVGMISAGTTFGGSHKLTAGIPWSVIMSNLDLKNP